MHALGIATYLVYPLNPLTYIRVFFAACERLQLPEGRHLRLLVYLLNLNLVLKIFHVGVYLGLFPGLGPLQRALHFDGIMLMFPLAITNTCVSCCGLLPLYYNGVLFLGGGDNGSLLLKLNRVLQKVLLGGSRVKVGDNEEDREDDGLSAFLASSYRGRFSADLVRICFSLCVKVFQSFSLVSVLFLLPYSHAKFALFFLQHADHFRNQSRLQLLRMASTYLISSTSYLVAFVNFSHDLTITFSCAFSLLLVFYIKLRQCGLILAEMLSGRKGSRLLQKLLLWSRFSRYRRRFTLNLIFFFRVNAAYGRLFLVCFAALCPVNVLINVGLANGMVVSSHFVLFFNVHQFLFVFVIHYLLTRCTSHIHRTKELFTVIVRENVDESGNGSGSGKSGGGHSRSRLSMALHLWAFHCWQGSGRYGCTYGSIALISVATFARFLMLYGKLLMMTSKMVNKSASQ